MKTFYLIIFSLLCYSASFAQETVELAEKLTKKITVVYHVLQTDPQVKHGLYQARHDKNMALVSGLYNNNKRIGLWHFFDYQGNLMQNFNYDKNLLLYEAPDDQSVLFTYMFDKPIKATDTLTKPIKVGGRYFGYINYMRLFKIPKDYSEETYRSAMVELLISPGGHLADYTIHLPSYNNPLDLNFNIDLLSDEDKTFIPATLNGQPVSARISIRCTIDNSGNLTFGTPPNANDGDRQNFN